MDPKAFEDVFHRHYPKLYLSMTRLLGDPAEAEDITLEAFWRLWRTPAVENGRCGGWLYRVASRLGYNALRSQRRRSSYEEIAGRDAVTPPESMEPASEFDRAERQGRVREALGHMSPRSAQLLILRASDLSYKEIAEILEVKPTSVGSLLARAEAEFVRCFGAE